MLFRNRPQLSNVQLPSDGGGWNDLANWLGVSGDELKVSGSNSLKEITVYTCIKILAETLGKLPLKIYQDSGDVRKATEHYLYPLLKLRPNPYMTAIDFWKVLETQRNIYGNAFAWIDMDERSGKITGLYPLDSTRVSIYVDDVGLISGNQHVWYVFTDLQGNQYKLTSAEMLHFKGLSNNGIAGMSTIETLKSSIENAKAAGQFLNNSYKNGMQTAGIINYVGELNSKAEQTFRENFERMSSGLKNANRISLLPFGYQYQPMALKLTDAQFLENTRLTLQQLTAAFGIKPHQVNDQSKTSYASSSEANREFYTDTLLSILTEYEQELTYKLFLPQELAQGYYVKFNTDVILRGDPKTRYETYASGVQNGFLTPNEARKLEEMPPKPGGDELMANGNYVPLTQVGAAYEKGGKSK